MLNPIEQILFFSHLNGAGIGSFWKISNHFPSLNAALNAPENQLQGFLSEPALEQIREFKTRGESSPIYQQIQKDLDWAHSHRIHLIDCNHEHYPPLLREIKRSPPLLYVLGDPCALNFPQVAIVGSRNPTPVGRKIAFDFGAELAHSGFTVTSGLALGIDTCAHRGAIDVNGRTIAVMGTGVDIIYPQRNRSLVDDILANGGAIVSEFPLGTAPVGPNFPQRNRIISGLSYGVMVVEAAIKSGSLITARYAIQQNREVFAVPGSIHSPLSRGCHALIKEGAMLVESAQDIVDELKGFLSLKWEQLDLDRQPNIEAIKSELVTSDGEHVVLSQLGYEPTTIDTLTDRTEMSVGDVMACLLMLELKGLAANVGSGYMRTHAGAQLDLSSTQ